MAALPPAADATAVTASPPASHAVASAASAIPTAPAAPAAPVAPATQQLPQAEVNGANGAEVFDEDPTLGDDLQSDTTTLASTILRNREELGRTYHKFRSGQNDYYGPNDEQQNNQLDIGHHMLTLLLDNRLYLAPLKTCQRAIDLGCGTGIWTLDFADAHPEAEVIGVDLSPTQPGWVAPNCRFLIDDFTSEWVDEENSFDFVHIRCLMGSVSDWPAVYRDAYSHMKPGGWIQHMEMDILFRSDYGTLGPDHILEQWPRLFIDVGEKIGKTFHIANNAARLIADAGFTDVTEKRFKVPLGRWPKDKKMKDIGFWSYHYCMEGCEGWALYLLTHVLGWSLLECQIFIAKFKKALSDRHNLAYYYVVVVYAQKPKLAAPADVVV